MLSRTKVLVAAASLAGLSTLGMMAATTASASPAATPHMVPANTAITAALKSGTNFTAKGAIDGISITVTCTSVTASGKTPANGLTAKLSAPPTFTGCSDSLGGTDTVTTNDTNGAWSVTLASTGKSGTLNVPKAGATFSSSVLSSCVVTVAPTATAKVKASYNDKNTATFKSAALPVSGSGCTASTPAHVSSTIVITPGVSVQG